jgi:hypothetical protein
LNASNSTPFPPAATKSRALPAIFCAGLVAGVLDISAAFITWAPKGITPSRILHGIASAAIGPRSFQGGWPTAALGLAFHFLIAFTAAAVFYAASRKISFMLRQPVLAGIIYGVLVYGFMYWVVVPLSMLHRGPVTLSGTVIAVVTHMICVGLPISLIISRFSR